MNNVVCRKIKTVFTIMVLGCLGVFCVLNLWSFFSITKQTLENSEISLSKSTFSEIENTFRENVTYHNSLVNAYGAYQKVIDHKVVGNFEFVADDGVLHMINDTNNYSVDYFLSEMQELKAYTEEKGVPLVYVQAPNREIADKNAVVTEFNIDDETMDISTSAIRNMGIPVLDIREELETEEHDFALSDIFFHTDLHMQTDPEIWMGAQVADFLEEECGVAFEHKEYLTDMSYYTKKSYDLLGNYGRTNGKYFVGLDIFDSYYPDFPTSYSFYTAGDKASAVQGNFENIVLNGYQNNSIDEYTYWVTNYGRFTLPSYTYINNNQNTGKILFITDSMAYRAMSYMSLTAHQITVLDPRYFEGGDYIRMALEEDYDAVVVLQANYLIGREFLK